jgi:hypothetical protein
MVWGTRLFAKEWEVTFWEALLHLLRKRRP